MTNVLNFAPVARRTPEAIVRADAAEALARREAQEDELRRTGAAVQVMRCRCYDDLIDLFDVVAPDFRISLTQTTDAFVLAAERIARGARSAAEYAAARAHLHALLDDVLDERLETSGNDGVAAEDAPML